MIKISLEGIELDRLLILEQVKNPQLTQEEAGKRLNVSSRQIRRLMRSSLSTSKCNTGYKLEKKLE